VGRRLPLIHDAIMRLRAMESVSLVSVGHAQQQERVGVGGMRAHGRHVKAGTCWVRAVCSE
jgi:hypothetical protein